MKLHKLATVLAFGLCIFSALANPSAALAGFDQGELVTIPSLPCAADWSAHEAARQKLIPNLSLNKSAARYRAAEAA